MRRRHVLGLVLLCLLLTEPASRGQTDMPDFDPVGVVPKRGYFSQLPFERVDMLNGNLVLTFTDLVLPGNAGMDLRIQRTFNKQNAGWRLGLAGVPMDVINPEAAPPEGGGPRQPWLRTADGTVHDTAPYNGLDATDVWVTDEFWRYTLATRTVELPNGWKAFYNNDPDLALLDEVRDPFGNAITVDWEDRNPYGPLPRRPTRFTQLIDEQVREVTFTYETDYASMPKTMVYLDRTWVFDYGDYGLERVTTPDGGAWVFDYTDGLAVTTPGGGTVHYGFATQTFPDNDPVPPRQVVQTRSTGGRDIPSGTWTFTYIPQPSDFSGPEALVQMPDGRTLFFKHIAAVLASEWVIGQTILSEGDNDVSMFERQYEYRSVVPWGDSLGTVPVTSLERVVQDGQTYTTQFEYSPNDLAHRFGDYHRPYKITESGQSTRITEREFDYAFDFYVLDRTKSVTVSMGPERFTTSYDYEDSNGFLNSETVNHVTTTYSPGLFGNRASATDANGNTTEFTYDWGVVKNTTTEEYGITRTINSDGTVHGETRGGLTTSFGYDALRRLTSVSIPGRDTTSTSYAADGSSVTVSRGTTFATTFLDGY